MITEPREKAKCKTFHKGTHVDHILDHILKTFEWGDADDGERNAILAKKYIVIIQPLLPKSEGHKFKMDSEEKDADRYDL